MACIRMLPAEEAANKDEIKITVISSLLFQELLDFNKPIQVRWESGWFYVLNVVTIFQGLYVLELPW